MFLSSSEFSALSRTLELLSDDMPPRTLRRLLAEPLLTLFHADQYASFVWDRHSRRFSDGVWLNMDAANIARYESSYQFISPITAGMQAQRRPTIASEIYPYNQLLQSDYYTNFLARDGLHWGMALHLFDGPMPLGDVRIWRERRRQDFAQRDKDLLGLLQPCMIRALARSREDRVPHAVGLDFLSQREADVARMIGDGMTDKEIARELGISPATVRTYINRLFDKLDLRRRASLAAWSRSVGLGAEREGTPQDLRKVCTKHVEAGLGAGTVGI